MSNTINRTSSHSYSTLESVGQKLKWVGREAILLRLAKDALDTMHRLLTRQCPPFSKYISDVVVLAPLAEEFLFRGCLQGSIAILQTVKNQICKTFPSNPKQTIYIHFFTLQGSFNQYLWQIVVKNFRRVRPSLEKARNWAFKAELSQQDLKTQQVFRVHLTAFLFAAAHLTNPHASRFSALFQFTHCYIGGTSYSYLKEKYNTLSITILAHGLNNALAMLSLVSIGKPHEALMRGAANVGLVVTEIFWFVLSRCG